MVSLVGAAATVVGMIATPAVATLGLVIVVDSSILGIIGFNVLSRFRLTVDYQAQRLTLDPVSRLAA